MVMSWTNPTTYSVGEDPLLKFFVNCTRLGGNYMLTYTLSEVGPPSTMVATHSWSWTPTTYWADYSDLATGLPAGTYCLLSELYESGVLVATDGGTTCFVIQSPNTAPVVSNVMVSPTSPTNLDILTCSYTYTDAENDPDQSVMTWYVNGVADPSLTGNTAGPFAVDDQVMCSVTASDGSLTGNTASHSVTVVLQPGGPNGGGSLPGVGALGTLAMLALVALVRGRNDA